MATIKKVAEDKPKTGLVSKEMNIKTILKEAVGTVVVLSREETEKKLKALVKSKSKDIANLIAIPELNKAQLEEAKAIRSEIRENRYALQNVAKHNTTVLNTAKKNNGLMIDELTAILTPAEDVIDEKIKAEENRIKLAKEAEEKAEEERILAIEEKISEAGIFFEKELEEARKTKDWTKFDEFYKTFEEGLEDLQEFEFEGTEVLEKYSARKEEIVTLIKQAEDQAEKDKELSEKEATLEAEKAKAEEEKNRMFEMFSIGFMFNGVEFFKGETEKFTQSNINEMDKEHFDGFVKEYKDKAEEEKNFNELVTEAEGLGLEWKVEEGENRVEVLTKLIEKSKEEKTEAEAKAEKEKKEAEAKVLKEEGKLVCEALAVKIEEMEGAYGQYELSEGVKNYADGFLEAVKKEFSLLKSFLNQED